MRGVLGAAGAEGLRRAAVWIGVDGEFRGSGFLVGRGLVVTAAHVVAGAARVRVAGRIGVSEVGADAVRARPAAGDGGLFFPYPDLAVVTVREWQQHPVADLAARDAEPGTEVAALGYSTRTPTPGVQPDSLALRVAGRSGDFVRLTGDGVWQGLSGSMLAGPDGRVVGVLKGSRSYKEIQGGWFTPVSALHAFLGTAPVPAPAPPPDRLAPRRAGPPTDADLVDALMAFPALAAAERRQDLLARMGDHLGLPYSFEAAERSARRDHLFQLVLSCRHHRDSRAALTALHTALEEMVPHDRALDRLWEEIRRALGDDGEVP